MNYKSAIIKVILSALFFICLLKMPYGYYQGVRFGAMLGFILLAYFSNQQGHKVEVIIYTALALLFQPFIKVSLGRTLWNVVDVILGVGLILSIFIKPKRL